MTTISVGRKMQDFVIQTKGALRREWRKVRVAGHAAQVLASVREL